jgi:hypothetical protein
MLTDEEIVTVAVQCGYGTRVPDSGYAHDMLWYDADLIPFARAILEAEWALREEATCPRP